MSAPLHLKSLVPDEVKDVLDHDPRLVIPVSTCEQHGPHLPVGCDGVIVERLADDLSAASGVLVAPTIAYGVTSRTARLSAGAASVRRKTLHRWMNDLVACWEIGGVRQFIILTANGHDPHQEALTTLRTNEARVFTVDVFALDFSDHLHGPPVPIRGGELDTSLMLYLAPGLVRLERAREPHRPALASAAKGERIYKVMYERIATRVLGVARR